MNSQGQRNEHKTGQPQCKFLSSIVIAIIMFGALVVSFIFDDSFTNEISLLEMIDQNKTVTNTAKPDDPLIIGQYLCQCSSYLSKEDCINNQCFWQNGCSQWPCNCLKDQDTCNGASRCSWTNLETCIQIDCTQITSKSSGGCKKQKCGQASIQNLDGSYNCTKQTTLDINTSIKCSNQANKDNCEDIKQCVWSWSGCNEATCLILDTERCDYSYQRTSTNETIQTACMIDTKSNSCMDVKISGLTQKTCNSISLNTHTWSYTESQCTKCVVAPKNTVIEQCPSQNDVDEGTEFRTCACTQYLSEYDCTNNQCKWDQQCQDTPTSPSNSSQLIYKNDCAIRSTKEICHGSYICLWSTKLQSCLNAVCPQLTNDTCFAVFENPSNIVLCSIDSEQKICTYANKSKMTPQTCNKLSRNTYTWSTRSSQCVLCANVQNILLRILISSFIISL